MRPEKEIVNVRIGGQHHKIHSPITGAEIRKIGGYDLTSGTLFRKTPGPRKPDEKIENDQTITAYDGDQFVVVLPGIAGGEGGLVLPPLLKEHIESLQDIYPNIIIYEYPGDTNTYFCEIHNFPFAAEAGWNINSGTIGFRIPRLYGQAVLAGFFFDAAAKNPNISTSPTNVGDKVWNYCCWNPSIQNSLAATNIMSFVGLIEQRIWGVQS